MLVCQRDLQLAVLSLKSLLRFHPRLAIAVTDDGSLTAEHRDWVTRHIPGARWHTRSELLARSPTALDSYPHLKQMYGSSFVLICKLLHSILLARGPRVIVCDPDTAFFESPQRLISWTESPNNQALYLHDHRDETSLVPAEVKAAFQQIAATVAPAGQPWVMEHYFFNSGLLAFETAHIDLGVAESFLRWRQQLGDNHSLRSGQPGMWFGDWTPEQTAFQVIYGTLGARSQPLGQDYHLGGEVGHAFNHFMRHYLIQEPTLQRLKGIVASLNK
ncbi:MAG TPA: hypothetical protein VL096_13890 [Pirellulaceae bacterium]|nr:hypothetical protein [Pirellulaceae bacterium]